MNRGGGGSVGGRCEDRFGASVWGGLGACAGDVWGRVVACLSARRPLWSSAASLAVRVRFSLLYYPLLSMSVWSLCLCLSSLLKLALREAGAQVTR